MNHELTADDLARALEQRSEIDLASHGQHRIVYYVTTQEYRVYDGAKLVTATGFPEVAADAYNEVDHR